MAWTDILIWHCCKFNTFCKPSLLWFCTFQDFYLGVLEEEQLEADDAQLKSCTLAYFGLKQIVVSIGMSGDFVNDKVKRLMKDLIMAPLYPNWELFEER